MTKIDLEVREIKYRDNTENRVTLFPSIKSGYSLICLPAMGIRAKFYEAFAQNLCTEGFNVITADWRGLGHSSIRASRNIDFGYKELIQDIESLIDLSSDWFPNTKKIIIGHSLGGQMGSLVTARFPDLIQGLVLVASCSVHYRGWEKRAALKLRFASTAFHPISKVVGYFPGNRVGFAGREARTVMKDWSYNARTGKYKPTNSNYDYEEALKRMKKPVLSISFENDYLASRRAVENLYKKFSHESEVTHLHLNSDETGVSRLNHFSWVKEPRYFVELIKKWINTNIE